MLQSLIMTFKRLGILLLLILSLSPTVSNTELLPLNMTTQGNDYDLTKTSKDTPNPQWGAEWVGF